MTLSAIRPPDFAQRVLRTAWGATWLVLFRPSPTFLHGWRRFLLRLFGARIGPGAHPYPSARIWAPWNLVMEEDACLGPGADCYNVAPVTIGPKAIVSQKAYLCTATHSIDPDFVLLGGPIVLEASSWVAASALVGPGVTVRIGAVVGAGAVAMKDVPAHKIVIGNPARPVGDSQLAGGPSERVPGPARDGGE